MQNYQSSRTSSKRIIIQNTAEAEAALCAQQHISQMPRQSSSAQSKYKFIRKLGSGAFADVIEAVNTTSGEHVAIKKMKQAFYSVDQVQKLPELYILKQLYHSPFSIGLEEILFDRQTGKLALVLELMENNMYEAFKEYKEPLEEALVQAVFFQCCCSVYELHSRGWMHRDIKPENYLVRELGSFTLVKLADFGSVTQPQQNRLLTEYISTRWYRAPEILLTDGDYGFPADIFALGCILYELLTNIPLFPGKDELDQLLKEYRIIGVPSKHIMQKIRRNTTRNPIKYQFIQQKGCGVASKLSNLQIPEAIELIEKMISYDPDERLTIYQVLQHPYFSGISATFEVAKTSLPESSYVYLQEMAEKFVAEQEPLPGSQKQPDAPRKTAQKRTRQKQRKPQAEHTSTTVMLQGVVKAPSQASSQLLQGGAQLYITTVQPLPQNTQVNLPYIIVRKK